MSRQKPLPPTAEQSALLRVRVRAIDTRINDNKAFIEAFILLVDAVTGRRYSALDYGKLLAELGVARRPSTTTIHDVKNRLQAEVPEAAVQYPGRRVAREGDDRPPSVPALAIDADGRAGNDLAVLTLREQVAHARERLLANEHEMKELRTNGSQLEAALAGAVQRIEVLSQENEKLHGQLASHTEQLGRAVDALESARKWMLLQVDAARGETREHKARADAAVSSRDKQAEDSRLREVVLRGQAGKTPGIE